MKKWLVLLVFLPLFSQCAYPNYALPPFEPTEISADDLRLFGEAIVESDNFYTKNIKSEDLKNLGRAIIESDNFYTNNIKSEDLKRLGDAIVYKCTAMLNPISKGFFLEY